MTLTLLDIYNNVTGQSWSVFDTDVESQDEFDKGVLTSIQKALNVLWHSYNFSFRLKRKEIKIFEGKNIYTKPAGMIKKDGIKLYENEKITTLTEIEEPKEFLLIPQKPQGFYVISDKIILDKIPDKNYKLVIDYYTSKLGINNQNEGIYNLKNYDDRLDIPPQFEDLFLRVLATKSMVNAIASTQSRNYQPFVNEFIENYRTLLRQSSGVEHDKTIEI
ncbi:hypothetical protein IJS77_03100 [bacterium]|nr:hypothetical protein [bacterium]